MSEVGQRTFDSFYRVNDETSIRWDLCAELDLQA